LATPTSPVVLLIESSRRADVALGPILEKKGFRIVRVTSGKDALSQAKSQRPAVAVLDSLAWRGDCAQLCGDLRKVDVPLLVLLPEGGANAPKLPTGVATLTRPFTPRKLTNCVKRLLPEPGGDVLKIGDVQFNVQHRHVRKGSTTVQLTPMQAKLLEVFMRHPGETLSRHYLIKQVWNWNTDDLNDTRTLDVHVRWLRQIIEDDSNVPCYLATVRGVGYRFGPPEKTGETGK
jgi:two-component system, OmpR family, alkaline phosphatase synthesis response regulator PhoP